MRKTLLLVAVTAAVLTGSAFTMWSLSAPPAKPAATLTYTTTDYAFTGPVSTNAGWTSIGIVNRGTEAHQAVLVRLAPGKTMADFARAAGGPAPSWATIVGGPIIAEPRGGRAAATVYLAPGTHVLVCFIPSPDGKRHIAKGMMKELAVHAVTRPRGSPPRAGLVMRLTDYDFDISGRIRPGRHTIRAWTDASQPHEVVMVELNQGATAMDFVHWAERMQGPPPGRSLGGVGLSPRETAYFSVNLKRGARYGLVCFFPDHKDGRPHFMHGMVKEITVE